jgi:hypothetical protein
VPAPRPFRRGLVALRVLVVTVAVVVVAVVVAVVVFGRETTHATDA